MKNVLITGKGSYIGENVKRWLGKNPEEFCVTELDMQLPNWKEHDFSQYDSVFHVAGIAHADVGHVSEERKQFYYKINTDLAIETAKKAKKEGVRQFILMSSMIVYGNQEHITKETKPCPANFYGDSKWKADQGIRELGAEEFKVVVLRPPMIYGKNSKGNYPQLAKMATCLPVFPYVKNHRSMLHIDNLCEFVKLMIQNDETGVFFPQNEEYTVTSDMVKLIAVAKGHKIWIIQGFGWLVKLTQIIPGKIGRLAKKAFGDSMYDMDMSLYEDEYRVHSLQESIKNTEGD